MSVVALAIGLLVTCAFVALVLVVLGLVLAAVRKSGRSASRGSGTGEGGAAFHGGTAPGVRYGAGPQWSGRAGRSGEYSAEDGKGDGDTRGR